MDDKFTEKYLALRLRVSVVLKRGRVIKSAVLLTNVINMAVLVQNLHVSFCSVPGKDPLQPGNFSLLGDLDKQLKILVIFSIQFNFICNQVITFQSCY